MDNRIIIRLLYFLLLAPWFLFTPLHPLILQAQATASITPNQVTLSSTGDGVLLEWQLPVDAPEMVTASAAQAVLQTLPLVRWGEYELPMRLATLRIADGVAPLPQVQTLKSMDWPAPLVPSAALAPPVLDMEPLPAFTSETTQLPTAPVFIVREGRMRGQRLVVVAMSPFYQEAGGIKLAQRVAALLPGAQLLTDEPALLRVSSQPPPPGGTIPPVDSGSSTLKPTNQAAFTPAIKVSVSQVGLQRVLGAPLIDAGLAPGMKLANLRLTHRGKEFALEVRDLDGLLDTASELRFYAAPGKQSMRVGDRWNLEEIFWLAQSADAGLRMAIRNATPVSAPERDTAFAQGVWENNKLYESNMAGADGDHWFALRMSVDPAEQGNPGDYDYASVDLAPALPLTNEPTETSIFTLTGSARSIATHNLRVNLGPAGETLTWTNTDYYQSWQQTIKTTQHPAQLELILFPGLRPSDIRLDKVYWRQPVQLNFDGQGAHFTGVAGRWQYVLSALPENGALYDISDPLRPVRMEAPWGVQVVFEDGPQASEYVVAGPGALHTPSLLTHRPISFENKEGADIVYIAPSQFHDELTPLVAHRQRQGYRVQVVDVQAIYDAWSDGQVSPQAIRSFLRYVVQYWEPAPIAAVLVGDSTTDPLNYTGAQNPNVIPAYFAEVDPWLGEVACENCFAQLDGESPLDESSDPGFLIDIGLGRFSAQDEAHVTNMVNKILRFETRGDTPRPLNSLYVADDYIHPDGAPDPAGDFAAFFDRIIRGDPNHNQPPLQPAAVTANRLYYDPRPGGVSDPWREPNATQARQRVIEELNKGPLIISYNGHANHYQWASTVRTLPNPYLLGTNDVAELQNSALPGIVLEMTCLTGQFTQVSASGTTIDERFQRSEQGGAAAVWGSAGLTVAYGHDALMHGFYEELWRSPNSARLGQLVEAGYLSLFQQQGCCQATRKVYLLLGDPLSTVVAQGSRRVYMPFVRTR